MFRASSSPQLCFALHGKFDRYRDVNRRKSQFEAGWMSEGRRMRYGTNAIAGVQLTVCNTVWTALMMSSWRNGLVTKAAISPLDRVCMIRLSSL